MFEAQILHFKDQFRCIAYDHRGQGESEVATDGYDMDTGYEDAVALIEGLGVGAVHFVGLSMGGFIGMRLAARRPDLVKSLILLETSADPEPEENIPRYRLLNNIVKWFGIRPVVSRVMPIMFSQSFLNNPARKADRAFWAQQLRQNKRTITRAVNGVITRKGVADELHKITCPSLILVGDEDVATVPAKAERIHHLIPHAQLSYIAHAGHTSCVEEPQQVNQAMAAFLKAL